MVEQAKEKIVDPKTGLNDFIEFTDKALYVSMQNWRTVEEVDTNNPAKTYVKFKADVWKFGDSKELLNICADKPKILSVTHVDFRKKINALLENKKPSEQVMIRAKIVDSKSKPIVYDVELA